MRPVRFLLPVAKSSFFCTILFISAAFFLRAQNTSSWQVLGPDGGDARSIAAVPGDPMHMYLGTTNSWIYESLDGGAHWRRLAKIEASDDLIIDRIFVSLDQKKTIFAGGWKLDGNSGGLWVSYDGGVKWNSIPAMQGQSVRSFAQSASDPAQVFVGTLKGVYRSKDYGKNWSQISPAGSTEIHEVQSLAVDPKNPSIIYAGTWHLPWKTTDGGVTWNNIKEGMIDDSDVFSIIIDPANTDIVYASACSGIYKSESGGALFHKIQGIPATARRTRVLMQDPIDHDTVYAGTTEGLYKTTDGGKNFNLMTSSDVIVNGIYVSPADHNKVLLATDRSGVLVSNNGGETFSASNAGFSQRKVEALLVAHSKTEGIFAGVANDKNYGGVFYSSDEGASWKQLSEGLNELDVFDLAESPDGRIFAGTEKGIYSIEEPGTSSRMIWKENSKIVNTTTKMVVHVVKGKKVKKAVTVSLPARKLNGAVYALDLKGDTWLAATSEGAFTSKDKGASWQGGPILGIKDFTTVAAHGSTLAAANDNALAISKNSGSTWEAVTLPSTLSNLRSMVFASNGVLWVGSRDGIYFYNPSDGTWSDFSRFPLRGIDDIYYDSVHNRMLVSSRTSEHVYVIDPEAKTWTHYKTGYHIKMVGTTSDRMIAASRFDGVIKGPEIEKTSDK